MKNNMNRKTIILISTTLFFSSTLFAQGFANLKAHLLKPFLKTITKLQV